LDKCGHLGAELRVAETTDIQVSDRPDSAVTDIGYQGLLQHFDISKA